METNFSNTEVLTQVADEGSTALNEGVVIIAASIFTKIVRLVVSLVICLVGAFGNSLVILSILRFPKMRTVTNYLLLSLAVTDLVVCISVGPLAIYDDWRDSRWDIGPFLCHFWKIANINLICCSIWHLCAVSIDRYLALFRPVWYRTKRKMSFALILISVSWVVTTLISVSLWMTSGTYVHEFSGVTICVVLPPKYFATFAIVLSFFIPGGVILMLYARMMTAIFGKTPNRHCLENVSQQPRNDSDHGHPPKAAPNESCGKLAVVGYCEIPLKSSSSTDQIMVMAGRNMGCSHTALTPTKDHSGHSNTSSTETQETKARCNEQGIPRDTFRKERRATGIIAVIVSTFMICWGPFFVTLLGLMHAPEWDFGQYAVVYVSWLGYSNSAMNPIIYTSFNRGFRLSFKSILTCKKVGIVGFT